MKKIIVFVVFLMTSFSVFAQSADIKAGLFAAIPLGEARDISNAGIGVNVSYMRWLSERAEVGFTTGAVFFKGNTIAAYGTTPEMTFADATYLPLAATGRWHISETVFLGADVGYALGFGKEVKDGFLFRPTLGLKSTDRLSFNIAFTGLRVEDRTWKSLNIGVEFTF